MMTVLCSVLETILETWLNGKSDIFKVTNCKARRSIPKV